MRAKYYKVANISSQIIDLSITTQSGEVVKDKLDVGEIVYGVNENAVIQLKWYQYLGIIKIEETDLMEDPDGRWLAEGF